MRAVLLIALLVCASTRLVGDARADQAPPLRILEVRAMPYYPSSGAIRRSTNLFDPRLALRNVVVEPSAGTDPIHRTRIEDWDIVYGTTATYVEVTIESASIDPIDGGAPLRIEMRARAIDVGREVQHASVNVAAMMPTESRVWHVPFLIYGTGCERLEITVRLTSDAQEIDMSVDTIPFSCGE